MDQLTFICTDTTLVHFSLNNYLNGIKAQSPVQARKAQDNSRTRISVTRTSSHKGVEKKLKGGSENMPVFHNGSTTRVGKIFYCHLVFQNAVFSIMLSTAAKPAL